MIFALVCCLCAVIASLENVSGQVNYQWDLSWVAGVEYTPARAPGNSLWWNKYDEYKPDVVRELKAASELYGFNHLRMFLHNMVFDVDAGKTLFAAMDDFLNVSSSFGFKVSFVFFDDCWNHQGASLEQACVPVKGRHNGCWMAIPQDVERTSVNRFHNYVYDTVKQFATDSRVAFWEIFNEPQNSNQYSMNLRHSAFQWALDALKAGSSTEDYIQPVPVLSCWDNNIDTQISDMHRYDTNFVEWTNQVFVGEDTMNTLITEGGSRWYQGYSSDAGSPLTVLHWYNHLKAITPSSTAPFNFGIVLNWELMVGESNTRWHWDTPDNSAEPTIPWDAHLFPDLTPVSYVEAAVIRNWTKGTSDFFAFDNFLPDTHAFVEDRYLCLSEGQSYTPSLIKPAVISSDGILIVETTIWPSQTSGGGILLQTKKLDNGEYTGYFIGFPQNSEASVGYLTLESWTYSAALGASNKGMIISYGNVTSSAIVNDISVNKKRIEMQFDMSALDCGLVTNGWNLLRVEINKAQIAVFANPMYPESATSGIKPRMQWKNSLAFPLFEESSFDSSVMLVGTASSKSEDKAIECTRFDYVGVLPK